MKKNNNRNAKGQFQKSVTGISWAGGTGGVSSAFSVQSLRAIDKTLSPTDAYALSIDLRAATHARAEPIAQGAIRFFHSRSLDEITEGDIVKFFQRPSPGMSTSAFLYELSSWWDLAGEMASGAILTDDYMVGGIYPLNPFRLAVQEPTPARHLGAVRKWRYSHEDGVQVVYGAESVVLMKGFNPLSSVRGLPPALAAVNEVSSAYEAIAYNRRFFSNNAEPSHIVNLPGVTDPKLIEAFKAEYEANHSIRAGQSHRVMVVGGSDVEIVPVSNQIKDAAFVGLQGLTTERIFRLYKVPPIHSGAAPTPGYSVEEQNKVFGETVLMPQAERISQFLQLLVDRFFRNAATPGTAKRLSKSMRAKVEKAKAERVESDVLVVLDLDHLPIIAALKAQKLDYAQKFQQTFKVSPFAAAEEVGVEIDENEANRKVWVASTEVAVDPAPQPEPATPPAAPPAPLGDDQQTDDARDGQGDDAAQKAARAFRKLVLDRLDEGRVFKLAEADALNASKHPTLRRQFRADYKAVEAILAAGGDVKGAAKKYLNAVHTKRFVKSL